MSVQMTLWKSQLHSGAAFGLLVLFFVGCSDTQVVPEDSHEVLLDSAQFWSDHIVTNPADPSRYVGRAAWHLRNGRITEGLLDLNLALEADSTHAPAWSAKADALYLTQAFEPCIEHLDACLLADPDHIPCLLRRAEMHIHLRQYPEAFKRLNDVLRKAPLNHEAYWMKGMIYRDQGNPDNARSSFQTAVEVNPDFFDGFIALGLAYAADMDTLAFGFFETAKELRPRSVEARYNLAYCLQEFKPTNLRFLDRARQEYQSILQIDSSNAAAAFNQGYIHLEYLQLYDSAAHYFSRAIDVLPYYHQAFYNRGLSYESIDNIRQAELDYREALRIKPDYTDAARALERAIQTLENVR